MLHRTSHVSHSWLKWTSLRQWCRWVVTCALSTISRQEPERVFRNQFTMCQACPWAEDGHSLQLHHHIYSTVQSPSWEATWSAASEEIPRISRNPKVHYHTHNRPPPVSILGQPNPVHIHTSHLLEIHPNIIRSNIILGLPSGLLPSGFPTKTLYTPSPHPYAPHAQSISFFSILSPAQYWVRCTNHLAPHYAISSISPLPRPS